MARRKRFGRWDWLKAPVTQRQEPVDWVVSQFHSLKHMAEAGYITARAFERFQEGTGLANFGWRVYYHRRPHGRVLPVTDLIPKAQGYVVFIHGWDGSHAVWEQLPASICQANPRLVCLAPDVNGFGLSPFIEAEQPDLELCGPRATMRAVEKWLSLLKLHRPGRQRQVFTFVGHSMGGAALFHKSKRGWAEDRYSLLALAPAMLHKDTIRQALYKTLGVGIGLGQQYNFLDQFKERLAQPLIQLLAANASQAVKQEHVRIFQQTAKGTSAQTFFALGLAEETPPPRSWDNVFVMLGHKDRLVAVKPTLDYMETLGLNSCNIQVVMGDHYFFSIGRQAQRLHTYNRSELLRHILRMHEQQRQSEH